MKFTFNVKKDGTMKIVLDKGGSAAVEKSKKPLAQMDIMERAFVTMVGVVNGSMRKMSDIVTKRESEAKDES